MVGLWTGLVPNIFRNAIINAAEIATFDQVKDMLLSRNLMQDNVYCHLVSSSIAGFTAAVVGSPVDVIKTRIMNSVKDWAYQERRIFRYLGLHLEDNEGGPPGLLQRLLVQRQSYRHLEHLHVREFGADPQTHLRELLQRSLRMISQEMLLLSLCPAVHPEDLGLE